MERFTLQKSKVKLTQISDLGKWQNQDTNLCFLLSMPTLLLYTVENIGMNTFGGHLGDLMTHNTTIQQQSQHTTLNTPLSFGNRQFSWLSMQSLGQEVRQWEDLKKKKPCRSMAFFPLFCPPCHPHWIGVRVRCVEAELLEHRAVKAVWLSAETL